MRIPAVKFVDMDAMIITRHSDGKLTAAAFPDMIGMTPELVGTSDTRYVTATVQFNFANGEATYRVAGWDAGSGALILKKLEG
jgi:hypothetical protein